MGSTVAFPEWRRITDCSEELLLRVREVGRWEAVKALLHLRIHGHGCNVGSGDRIRATPEIAQTLVLSGHCCRNPISIKGTRLDPALPKLLSTIVISQHPQSWAATSTTCQPETAQFHLYIDFSLLVHLVGGIWLSSLILLVRETGKYNFLTFPSLQKGLAHRRRVGY